ncbi:NAD(P)H-binding protein [Chitiniphilus purpureus]|uniref:NAD(P)H-binding protein n=1 Tax=Chitiniphilus purpureus TaxID=2981137 RepID=A0ABY6DMS1_9NEIS|nr:NAD(P)H-binding protein [Chitiniphilus sp. CD1]UXY15665.1 NAD(P)H-binding protein [Chitiniphilus sp. CD1]
MKIAVMGASGRTGSLIAQGLLQADIEVVALGRDARRLAVLQCQGAQVALGNADDATYLAHAFEGADAVYTLLPYDLGQPGYLASQERQSTAITRAIAMAGVGRVVQLSSLGADQTGATGMIRSLHTHEARLGGLEDVDLLLLRPSHFFENFGPVLPTVLASGVHADAVDPAVKLPMLSTHDIADAAIAALLEPHWHGRLIRELLGPCDLDFVEVTALIAAQASRPDLRYQQISPAELLARLREAGFATDVAALCVELVEAFNSGLIHASQGRSAATTTPTTLQDALPDLFAMYTEWPQRSDQAGTVSPS